MGNENRQRGNNNLLIVTNNVIVSAVEKKILSTICKTRDMTIFDMNFIRTC